MRSLRRCWPKVYVPVVGSSVMFGARVRPEPLLVSSLWRWMSQTAERAADAPTGRQLLVDLNVAETPLDVIKILTLGGRVRGAMADGIRVFRGPRYAEPAVGPLRWAPPQPLALLPAVVDATVFGPDACRRV
jgi:hypothetical protein